MEEFGKLSSVDTTLLSKAKNSVTSVRSALFFFFFFFLSLWNPFHFIFSIDLKKKKLEELTKANKKSKDLTEFVQNWQVSSQSLAEVLIGIENLLTKG